MTYIKFLHKQNKIRKKHWFVSVTFNAIVIFCNTENYIFRQFKKIYISFNHIFKKTAKSFKGNLF